MVQHIGIVFRAAGGVDGNADGTHARDGLVRDAPFAAVATGDGHLVAGADAERHQPQGQLLGGLNDLRRAVGDPLVTFLGGDADLLREVRKLAVQQVEKARGVGSHSIAGASGSPNVDTILDGCHKVGIMGVVRKSGVVSRASDHRLPTPDSQTHDSGNTSGKKGSAAAKVDPSVGPIPRRFRPLVTLCRLRFLIPSRNTNGITFQ